MSLLHILEDGRLTDKTGRVVSFANTVLIMTSNIGSQYIEPPEQEWNEQQRQEHYETTRSNVVTALRDVFRPELLNRIDEIIVFHALTPHEILGIVDLMLARVNTALAQRGMSLVATDAAKTLLAHEGYDPLYGARPLRRVIQKMVENPISSAILRSEFGQGDTIQVDADGDELRLRLVVAESG